MSADLVPISAIQPFTMLDFPGHTACIIFLAGCNFRCPYCHNSEFVLPEKIAKIKDDFISEDALFRFLEKRKGLLDGVVITGGEPTIHKNLPQFIKKIKDMGFLFKLDSNGTNPEMLEQLLKENLLDYVAMDIKGSPENYAKCTGAPVDLEKITKSRDLIMNSGVDYEFRTTIMPKLHNIEEIKKILAFIKGAKRYYLQNFRPDGGCLNPDFEKEQGFAPHEMTYFFETIKLEITECGVREG